MNGREGAMKTADQIEQVLKRLPEGGKTRFSGMTYEQGIEEALMWVLGEIEDDDLDYFGSD